HRDLLSTALRAARRRQGAWARSCRRRSTGEVDGMVGWPASAAEAARRSGLRSGEPGDAAAVRSGDDAARLSATFVAAHRWLRDLSRPAIASGADGTRSDAGAHGHRMG